jgi:hypothetical protein
MKKRYVPILTFTVALLLVGSIAYASDKKKKAKQSVQNPNELSEETLKVELLAATGAQHEKPSAALATTSTKNADFDTAKGKVKK